MCRELAGEGTKVGRAAKLRGCSKLGREDNQGGAKLSRALKDATRRMNLTLQPRHTQLCNSIYYRASTLKFYFLNRLLAMLWKS